MPSQSTTKKRLIRICVIPIAIYLIYIAVMFSLQHSILFPRSVANAPYRINPPTNAEAFVLTPEHGVQVECWFFPAPSASPNAPAPCVIYAHGNAERIDLNTHIPQFYNAAGLSVLMPEYRGYGQSTGDPSQHALSTDSRLAYQWLSERADVDPDRIIYHARSIGTAVLMELASTHPPVAMILDSPMESIQAMTSRYLLPPFLCRSPYRSDRTIAELNCPILIHHGAHDAIIPQSHGRTLADIASDANFVSLDCGHNDLPNDPLSYANGIRSFLADINLIDPHH